MTDILKETDLADILDEAVALVAQLPKIQTLLRSAALRTGSQARKRVGLSENFWQYRRYLPEDDAARIDWRRSGREEKLFIRETELETSRQFEIWIDPGAGFRWRSSPHHPRKSHRALTLLLANALMLAQSGETVRSFGHGINLGYSTSALAQLARSLWQAGEKDIQTLQPARQSILLIASDFYTPVEDWKRWLKIMSMRGHKGLLMAVRDSAEIDFDYSGRVEFSHPDGHLRYLARKAESLQAEYKKVCAAHDYNMEAIARQYGWHWLVHNSADNSLNMAFALGVALNALGEKK